MNDRSRDVLSLLSAYRPADAREAGHHTRMTALARSSGDLFSRKHFEPGHFTASAFILSPDGGSLLLIHHAKLDRWLQPGGHVEPDDADLPATATREVVEEVGIADAVPVDRAALDLDVHPIPARKDEPRHEHFDVRFLYRATSLDVVTSAEVKEVRWVPLADITRKLTDDSVMRVIAKLRGPGST